MNLDGLKQKVECSCCHKFMTFLGKPRPHELENWGFHYWGVNSDGTYCVTCENCTTTAKVKKNNINKTGITHYRLHEPPQSDNQPDCRHKNEEKIIHLAEEREKVREVSEKDIIIYKE